MAFDTKLLDILACPISKSPLIYDKENNELICKSERVAYAIVDDIPVLLENEARKLTLEEIEKFK